MGFFSDLFKSLFGTQAETPYAAPGAPGSTPYVQPNIPSYTNEEWHAYFEEIFESEFSEYTVQKNVSVQELLTAFGASLHFHPACAPIDYVFYKDNRPCLAVVLVRANTYRGMNVKGTQDICAALGLGYMRFFTEMLNEKAYVIDRLKAQLG